MIEACQSGRMVVDGSAYSSDLIVLHDGVIDGWWRKSGHQLWLEDLESVLTEEVWQPIVGTGAYGVLVVTEEMKALLERRSIVLATELTGQAWQTYNAAHGPGVVGAFHLTC